MLPITIAKDCHSRSAAAFHEAGRIVVAWHLGQPIELAIGAGRELPGPVTTGDAEGRFAVELALLLAGPIAEADFFWPVVTPKVVLARSLSDLVDLVMPERCRQVLPLLALVKSILQANEAKLYRIAAALLQPERPTHGHLMAILTRGAA